MLVRELQVGDRPWLGDFIAREWGLPVVSISGCHDPSTLAGFVAEDGGELVGAVTYRMDEVGCEVVTINSLREGRGVGSALLAAVKAIADGAGSRVWLITMNNNVDAIGFYQRRGMDMTALHRDFIEEVRRWKPGVVDAMTGDIPMRHALEFSY